MKLAVDADSDDEDESIAGTAGPILREPAAMIPRSYQKELLEQAIEENTIVYMETGRGKTHVAVMLLQHITPIIRKPSKRFAVFLCPTVCLVLQQTQYVRRHTDLEVKGYHGDMDVDAWKLSTWEAEIRNCEVFVMTPQILLQNLHHCFMKMDSIELLIFDECHHATKRHPYACIMQEFYHTKTQEASYTLPRILGMTASPIDGKVDRHGLNIEEKVKKIERMLHAKVYTPKERSELDGVVPRPLENIEYYECYERSNRTHLNTQRCVLLLSNLKIECIKKLLGSSSDGEEMPGEGGPKVERKMVKTIEKLYNSLDYCLKELGLWCTYEALNDLISRQEKNSGVESERNSEGKEAFLRAALSILESALDQENTPSSYAVLDEVADRLHLSPKVHTLINVLKRYRDTKYMRCIVFVERKIATAVLARLLNKIKCLSSHLQFRSLAGKTAGLMNHKHQQNVVDSFRDGEVNVLVSTNVAEEGLDIQSCCLVIRFDLPKTPCSLIQSRGRARCPESNYIYLIERDNNEQLDLMQQFKSNEESMRGIALSRAEPVDNLGAPETAPIETFQVESTGASISTEGSVSLLHRYCARLAHDGSYTPMPEFSYSLGSRGDVKCTVTLPPDADVHKVEGRGTASQADAKRIACLHACKLLYEAGALTDLLLLRSDEDKYPLDSIAPIAPKINHTAEKSPSSLHSTIVPDAFCGTWGAAMSSVTLYAYTVCFAPTPNDRAYVNFGLFLESDLGPEAGNMEVELQLTNRRLVNAKCSASGRVRFEPHQLRNAKLFQERLFTAVLDQKPGDKPTGEWSADRLYLLLPLKENLESALPPIDWECVAKLISDLEHNFLNGSSPDVSGGPLVKLYDGYVPVDYVLNSVVQTMHNDCIYCARELIPNLNAESPMVMKTNYSSYSDYYLRKHGTTLQHLKQPMLKAKRLIQVHNLLTQRNSSERPAVEEQKTEALVELPLELCRVRMRGLSCGLANGASLLPSFMHRLEGLLLAIQLRQTLSLSYQVSANLMLEAITTSKCQESFSLEGLELLGDAFLEVAVSEYLFLVHNKFQEGRLSQLRTSLIRNDNLEKLGKERGIMGYIRDIQFCPSDWAVAFGPRAEFGESDDVPVHPRDTVKKRRRKEAILQGKTIADVVEALIGAHYICVQGGEDAACSLMRWFGFEVDVDPSIRDEARMRPHRQLGLLPHSKIVELETLLKYNFENKSLLVEALTHTSCSTSGDSYQRLEFLGDAVLDFLITKHFYVNSAKLKRDPGLLTDLRSAAVNNECFARVAVRHNLHLYLLHYSTHLTARIDQYVKFVQDSLTEADHGWVGDAIPKVLSDLVESLAGAVLLDSNFDLDTVWGVFKQFLRPLVTPETLRLEPTRELRELCQTEKFSAPDFKKKECAQGHVVMTVTIQVKDETITEVARKPDKRSATKVAAIQALARLKERGYVYFTSRLLERKALYAKAFSDLVDVPEEGCSAVTPARESGTKLQGEDIDDEAADKWTPEEVVGHPPPIFREASNTETNHCEIAQKAPGRESEPETHSGASVTSKSEKLQQMQGGSSVQGGSGKASQVQADSVHDARPHSSDLEGTRITADTYMMDGWEDLGMAARFLKSRKVVSPEQLGASSSALHKKLCGCSRMEKRATSLSQGQNMSADSGRGDPMQSADVQDTLDIATMATFMDSMRPQGARRADVGEYMNIPPSLRNDASSLSAGKSVALNGSSQLGDRTQPGSKQAVASELSRVLDHLRGNGNIVGRGDGIMSMDRVNTVARSAEIQAVAHHLKGNAGQWASADEFTGRSASSSHQVDPLTPLSSPPPRPAPGNRREWMKGEARSLLNELCVKRRWKDPEYTCVQKGGVSHAPIYTYMVTTTFSMGEKAYEIDVEGEPMKDVKGAKDSAAAQALVWFQEQGIPVT